MTAFPVGSALLWGNRKKEQEKVTVTIFLLGGIRHRKGGIPQVKRRRLGSRPMSMFHWMSDLEAGHLSSPRLSFLTYKVNTTVPTSLDCGEVHKKEQSKNAL